MKIQMSDRRKLPRPDHDRRTDQRRDQLTEAQADRVESVFLEHRRFIENVARQHAPAADHVPDIIQAVGVQVCRGLDGFRGDSEIRTWLYRVTVNTARDYYRRERKHTRAVEAILATPILERYIDPDEAAITGQRLAALQDGVDRLRPRNRQTIEDMISNELGDPAVESDQKHLARNARRSRRFKARRQLREVLADDPRFEP